MTTYRCTPRTLDSALRALIRDKTRELERDALDVVSRGVAHAVGLTDAAGLVDQGGYRAGWKARRIAGGAETRNDAPHAGIMEHGRRPGQRRPPLEPILAWVRRRFPAGAIRERARVRTLKGGGTLRDVPRFGRADILAEQRRIAFAVQRLIGLRGMKPHFIMRRSRQAMQGWWRAAVRRRIGR